VKEIAPPLTGWRPAANLPIPGRKNWILKDRLGEGAFGELWLALHRSSDEPRTFKFCFDKNSLKALEREQELVHQTHEILAGCRHICRIYNSQLEKYPYFIESEYCNRGNIATWSDFFGGLEVINSEFLIEIVAQAPRPWLTPIRPESCIATSSRAIFCCMNLSSA